jgi:predicted Zn-dependent protease
MKKIIEIRGFRVAVLLLFLSGFYTTGRAQLMNFPDSTPVAVKYKYYYSEGLRQKMLGNPDLAIQNFQRCIDLEQVSGSSFYELGLLYSDKKDYSAAAGYARNAWKRDPSNKWYGLLLIQALMMQGNPGDCVPVYRELQKLEPGSEDFLTGEIEALILAKQEKEALKRIAKLPDEEEIQRWGVVRQKDIYLADNQFDKGTKTLLDWLKDHPEDYEIRGILAEAFASKGMKTEAEEQYAILKKQDPENPAVSFSLGQFYFQTGRKELALEEFMQGFRSPDINPLIKIEIIKSFITGQQQQQKLDESVVKLIRLVYQVDKGNPAVDELYANYLYSDEKLKEAEPLYRQLTRTDPGNFIVWQNLLFILNEGRRFNEILSVSDSALVYFPGQGLFHLFKGMAAIEKKDYPVAIAALNKGLSIPGQNADIVKQFYMSLAEALFRSGNSTEAFRNYDRMLVLEPENVMVLNNYSYYLSLGGEQLDKALEMISVCIRKEPDNTTYLDTFAWVLFKRKEYSKALEPMEKTIRLSKDPSGEVLEHYGDILFMNNRPEDARKAWEMAKGKPEASDRIDDKIKNGLK